MKIRWTEPGRELGAKRGEVVVCIPVYGAHELFVECLRSVLSHTPEEVRILVCDDASPDLRSQELVRSLATEDSVQNGARELFYARAGETAGFPANVNRAFAAAAPADVLILNSDTEVAEGWLEGMRQAAYSDSRVATVTSLTNHGTVVSVPDRGIPSARLPAGWTLDEAAAAIRTQSLRLRPRLPSGVGHCLYVRRTALELVGDFDLAFSPGYGEEVDFSQRCLRSGLTHLLADDVLVFHHGSGSFGAGPNPVQVEHERLLARRYPYYHDAVRAVEEDTTGPLARALGAARRALGDMHVVIDARILAGTMTGTQLHVLELIAGLSRTGRAQITALVPPNISHYAAAMLASLEQVTAVTDRRDGTRAPIARADLVHRPFQVNSPADLWSAAQLADRLVVTQQDMIAYHNPAYFHSFHAWEGYRELTRNALAAADRVLFFSAHARADALAEDLIEPGRAGVVHIGTDHTFHRDAVTPVRPSAADSLPDDAEVILCIGTDFRHKNRLFALRILEQLQERHAWTGFLVFAGPSVAAGSSAPDETRALAARPRLATSVLDVGAVSEDEKAWLMQRASLALYPTVHEGFGLVPFEAADHGVPCLWAHGTSLSEVLPDAVGGIVPWDPVASAENAIELIRSEPAREANLTAIRAAAVRFTWDATAAHLLEVYRETCDGPASPAGGLERRQGQMQGALSEDAMRLVGPDGALPDELERPLLALATHPQLAAPLFGVIRMGYRAAYRLRRRVPGNARPVGSGRSRRRQAR